MADGRLVEFDAPEALSGRSKAPYNAVNDAVYDFRLSLNNVVDFSNELILEANHDYIFMMRTSQALDNLYTDGASYKLATYSVNEGILYPNNGSQFVDDEMFIIKWTQNADTSINNMLLYKDSTVNKKDYSIVISGAMILDLTALGDIDFSYRSIWKIYAILW